MMLVSVPSNASFEEQIHIFRVKKILNILKTSTSYISVKIKRQMYTM